MSATVSVLNGVGAFQGAESNIGGYSVSEEATPRKAGDSSGAVGEFSFDAVATSDTSLLHGSDVLLSDGLSMGVRGKVASVSENDGFATISAQSPLSALVAERQIPPFHGTLQDALREVLGLVGIPPTQVHVNGIPNEIVAFPGGLQDVWQWVKDICVVHGLYLSVATPTSSGQSNFLFNADNSATDLLMDWSASKGLNISEGQIAQKVEVKFYNNTYAENALVYPPGGWDEDVQVHQVGAGDVLEVDLELGASLLSFKQPIMVSSVAANYEGPNSVYAIAGNDGLPVPAAMWREAGGKLELELDETTTRLKMTLTGPQGSWAENYGPFRVAMAADAGGSSTYSSLRIVGTGVLFEESSVVVPTGVAPDDSVQEVGITIENRAIANLDQAYRAAHQAATLYSGLTIDRPGSISVATDAGGGTLAQHGFASIVSARVRDEHAYYRVKSSARGPIGVEFTAEPDTRFSDFNAAHAGKTFADFNAEYAGWTFRDQAIQPL